MENFQPKVAFKFYLSKQTTPYAGLSRSFGDMIICPWDLVLW